MEKARGVQLYKVWDDLEDASRLKLMVALAQLERQLASIKLPMSGGLYFRKSMINEVNLEIPQESDSESLYCIGPSCDRSWWPTLIAKSMSSAGPCRFLVLIQIEVHNFFLLVLMESRVYFCEAGYCNHGARNPPNHRSA